MKLTVTVLDTTGIQPYIFGSNRLRENIGASYLVAQATGGWVRETLSTMGVLHPEIPLESSGQDAELVYAGGGNTVLLFRSHELAIKFTKKLSLKVLKEAPGINLVVAHREIEWDQDILYETVQEMMKHDLDVKKRSRTPSSPLLGLSVTQDCNSTRLVAVDMSKFHDDSPSNYPVSREILAKLDAVKLANEHLKQTIFDPQKPNKWNIPRDFDDFGRSRGENSYIAVVHIDGNSMGDRFKEHGKNKSDRDYIIAMQELSNSVEKAGEIALKQITQELITSWTKLKDQLDLEDWQLPFRPLVYGGDDVTFVCDGRLGLTLAARYLQIFEEQLVADGGKLTACAGVCIVKAHYPFARAYEMSEALCMEAKKVAKFKRRKKSQQNEKLKNRDVILSAIDWHIAGSGLLGSISEIREREYRSQNDQPLEMRPLLLNSYRYDWRTWESFTHVINEFEKEEWKNRRNKVMALREVLRRGSNATKEFLTVYQLDRLPDFPESINQTDCRESLAKQGWYDDTCGYFDVIEAIDFYLPLGSEP